MAVVGSIGSCFGIVWVRVVVVISEFEGLVCGGEGGKGGRGLEYSGRLLVQRLKLTLGNVCKKSSFPAGHSGGGRIHE